MSKELVTVFGTDDFNAIAAETGAFVGGNTYLPQLKINAEVVDDDGNQIPFGTYKITQEGVTVYGKLPVLFRPFMNTFQYLHYDSKARAFVNKTVIVKSFSEQMLDENGGMRCGKINAKELKVLVDKNLISAEELAKQKEIKCVRGLYGLVTMNDAVTADGDKVTIEDLPCVWKMQGTNFNAVDEALKGITKIRHLFFQHWLSLDKLNRKKEGSVTYFEAVVSAILDKEVPFTKDDMETFNDFKELIAKENNAVLAKRRDSLKDNEPFDLEADTLKDLELNDDISDI